MTNSVLIANTAIIILLLLLLLLSHSQANAQQSSDESIGVVEIVETRAGVVRFGSNATTEISLVDQFVSPRSLADIVDISPGVVKSGQNGLYQVFSIRGAAGQRIQTRFNGIPIATERRAGTAASFIDPWFIQNVNVVRGSSSTLFGSGAVGGVLLTESRFIEGVEAEIAYESDSVERSQLVGFGSESWSVGISSRSANNGITPQKDPLNSGYQQQSAIIQNRGQIGDIGYTGLFLSSQGKDIGRSNALFPQERIANVGNEEHHLLQLNLDWDSSFKTSIYAHDQSIDSDLLNLNRNQSNASNQSLNWGAHINAAWQSGNWSGQVGLELDARDNVKASELLTDLITTESLYANNLDAKQKSLGLFVTTTLDLVTQSLHFGIRQNHLRQSAAQHIDNSSNSITGFASWQWYFRRNWSFSIELANSYRDPTLTERYFSGSTARGVTIGNPLLEKESAPSLDLGLHWHYESGSINAHLFHQQFDDYIERTILDTETRGFANISDGDIKGIEIEGVHRWSEGWQVSYNMHWIEGENNGGVPIADVPAAIANVGFIYSAGRWSSRIRLQHRFSKNKVAVTEQALDAANVMDLDVQYDISDAVQLVIYARNSLNDAYLISADEISTLANRHTLGARLRIQLRHFDR